MKESSLFKYKATESAPARPRIFSKKKKPNSISNGISGGGGGGSWISSKKSAKEIQQDKERARKAFDANRNRGKTNKSSKAEPSKKKSKRKNRKHDSEDDEDDDDLDDFIVHTDEEEVEQFDGAETDDEDEQNLEDDDSIVEVTSGGKRNANILGSTKKRKRRRRLVLNQVDSDTESENYNDDERDNYAASEDEDNDDHNLDLDDEEEEDDDDDDVKETMSNRKRQKTTVSSHKRTSSSTASKATYGNKKKKKDLKIDLVDLNSDDDTDDEMLTTPVFQQKAKNSSTPKSTKSSMTVSSSSQSPTPESETEYERKKESKFSSKLHSKSRLIKPQAQEEKTKTASKSSLYKHFASKSEQQTKQQDKSKKKSENGKLSSYFQSPTKPSPKQNDSLEDTPIKPRDSLVNTTTTSSSAKQQFESLEGTGTGGNKKKRLIIDDSSSDDESLGYIAQDMLSQKGDSIVDDDFEQVLLESTHDNFYVSKDMLSSDDDDEEIMTSKRKKKQKAKTKGKTRRNHKRIGGDSSSSEDEEDSINERGRKRPSIMNIQPDKKINKKESKGRRVIQLNSDTDDEKDDNDQEVDVYYVNDDSDREEDKAKSILDATTSLSKKILNKLSLWCSADDNNSDGDEEKKSEGGDSTKAGTPAISGMIVSDGALALNQTGALSKHPMIVPKDEIEQICQGLKLADYQLLGVNWMALLNQLEFDLDLGRFGRSSSSKKNISHQVNGVLADEMGLGKTVQTIAFLAWLKFNQKSTRPSIIVVPASVLSNWQREFQKFCPKMKVVKYHGILKVREEIKDELWNYLPNSPNAGELDVVLTTFSYFSSEKQDDRNFLRKFKFDYLIIDEAHCLKNPQGSRYRNLNRFSTSHRLLLTGTPVQNNPSELLSLLSFMMPLFAEPDTGGQNDDFTTGTGGGFGSGLLQHFNIPTKAKKSAGVDEDCYFQLKQLLAPFVLRRKKVDVLSQLLPPKKRKVEFVPFDEVSRKIYDSVLSETASNLKSLSCKNTKKAKESNNRAYANTYVKMRKAANHPLLLRTRWTEPSEIEPLAEALYENEYYGTDASCTLKLVREQLETLSDFQIHCTALEIMEEVPSLQLSQYTLAQEDLFCSAKFARLRTLLPELISEGHRMLIFSQWTSCLDLLGCLMENLDLKYLRLDGQTKIDERQNMIDEYNTNTDIKVFLLSTRAGGMGINLTSADTCILHDLDFNPFNDLQAEDRCHRIGQTKPVTIIKMVTADTVDSLIYQMQENKTKMNVAILGKREEDSQPQLIQEIVQQALKEQKNEADV